jgi:hypothetical protein
MSTSKKTYNRIDIEKYLKKLHSQSGTVLERSLSGQNSAKLAKSRTFATELMVWQNILGQRREGELLKAATSEYESAIIVLTQGHYRHAFHGLRLTFELTLQAVFLSKSELLLREWLDGRIDTNWNTIVDPDNGLFSQRFALAFFPELQQHIKYYREMAIGVYRDCSEYVHGNYKKQIPLPKSINFDEAVFKLWHSKADIAAMVLHFALSLRYLRDLQESEVSQLEPIINDRLGHIKEIRELLGGPTKE